MIAHQIVGTGRWLVLLVSSLLASVSVCSGQPISQNALNQIEALTTEKQSRTLVEHKIDSQLLYARKQHAGQKIASGVTTLRLALDFDAGDRVSVDIKA